MSTNSHWLNDSTSQTTIISICLRSIILLQDYGFSLQRSVSGQWKALTVILMKPHFLPPDSQGNKTSQDGQRFIAVRRVFKMEGIGGELFFMISWVIDWPHSDCYMCQQYVHTGDIGILSSEGPYSFAYRPSRTWPSYPAWHTIYEVFNYEFEIKGRT